MPKMDMTPKPGDGMVAITWTMLVVSAVIAILIVETWRASQ